VSDSSIAVITDEMITPRLADFLRLRGYDVISCHAVGRASRGISDPDQLTFAAGQGRAIHTFNARHFRRLHYAWGRSGRPHAGIIVSEDLNSDLPEMIRRLQRHLDTVDASQQHNRFWTLDP